METKAGNAIGELLKEIQAEQDAQAPPPTYWLPTPAQLAEAAKAHGITVHAP